MFKILIGLSMLCSLAFADSQLLASLDNQEDSSIIMLYASVGVGGDIEGFEVKRYLGEKIENHEIVSAEELFEGMSLGKVAGRDIVRITSPNFAFHQGGELLFSYLYNGMTGSRGSVTMDLSRSGDTWELSHKGKVIEKIHVISKRVLGRAIGIAGVRFGYKD